MNVFLGKSPQMQQYDFMLVCQYINIGSNKKPKQVLARAKGNQQLN